MKRTSGLISGKALRDAGMINPAGDTPCGARDLTDKFPEPRHYDCNKCHLIIRDQLAARVPAHAPEPEPKQLRLPAVEPED